MFYNIKNQSKAVNKGLNQETSKKKKRKRKSIVFKPEKCAKMFKCSDTSKDDSSEISFSPYKEEMIPLNRRSDFKRKVTYSDDTQDTQELKKKKRKRKSIVFQSEKGAKVLKCSDTSMGDTTDISFSLDEEKTILSDGRSDFDTNYCYEMDNNETSENTSKSSNILEEFFINKIDEQCSDDSNTNGEFMVESFESKNSSMMKDSSNDSIESTSEKSQVADELDPDNDTDSGYEMHEFDTDYIVILKYSQSLKIFGFCDVKVLHGKINILGHCLNNSSPKQSIYSPKGTSLLTLKNTSNYNDETCKMKLLVSKLIKHPKLKDLEVRKDSSVLLFLKKQDPILDFIQKHISQLIVPKINSFPCVKINPKGSWNSIHIPEDWNRIVQNATCRSKILICGGKGVGKSTFLRYAINCLLQKYKSVRVVDLDPGQSEFSVPSTLSIITIVEPLLGVNYTHLKTANRSILSDINIAHDPEKFIKCVQEILKNDVYIENVPTIINTMGFMDDIAFHLMSSTIALLEPNHIVYIESSNKKRNFKIEMDKKSLHKYVKSFTPNLKPNFKFDIEKIPSVTDDNVGWTLQSRQMREMCILAYFGQLMTENCNTLQDDRLPMYEFDLLEYSVTDKNNISVSVETETANIVALCRLVDDVNSVFECFGWGVLRCHNPSTRKIVLITPVDEEILEKVTHFVVGCLTLPPAVYMNQEGVSDCIPYVAVSDLKDLAQMSRRTRIPFVSNKK